MQIQLINRLSTNDREVGLIADVCQQYADLVTFAHGMLPVPVTFKPGAKTADADFCPLYVDNTPTVQGAEGFHDLDASGPYGEAFLATVQNGEWLKDPQGAGQSMAGVITHELAEMIKDAFANAWRTLRVRDPRSRKVYSLAAEELADWCQNFAFTLKAKDGTQIDASDFCYPDFFNPQAKSDAQMDHMRVLTYPGEVGESCYGIVAVESGDGQVFGRLRRAFGKKKPTRIFHATAMPPPWREKMFELKKHSRSKKRLGV